MKMHRRQRLFSSTVLLLSVGLSILLTGCRGQDQSAVMSQITMQEAQDRILGELGIDRRDGVVLESSYNTKNGIPYYAIKIERDGVRYYFDLDAMTGAVIETNYSPKGEDEVAGSQVAAASESTAGEVGQISAATDSAGEAGAGGQDISQPAMEDGSREDKRWGILEDFCDAEGGIGIDRALAMVFERVPGAGIENLKSLEIEDEDGILEYEGELVYDGMEYEFEIDAYSGSFREWKAEYDD